MDTEADFQQLIDRGLAASARGRTEDALAHFRQAATADPSSGVPHFLIASEHASLGQVAPAEQAFANAVLLSPQLHVARYQLGLLQFSSGRAAIALVTWQPLLSLPPAHAMGHFVRGFAALAQEKTQEALAHWREGLPLCTDNPAMATDIQKVIDTVSGLAAASGPTADPGQHLLLSAYARSLH